MVVVGLQDGTLNTFTYDATGLRRKSQAGAATTNFVLDGQDVLMETHGNGTLQARYTNGLGAYGPLISQTRSSSTSIFHHFDALGSTTELTSAAAAVTDTYRYYAFGETRASSGSTVNPFGFVGRLGYYTEPSLALQYLRARWYQPAAGRFTSRDPLDTGALYSYASNTPVRGSDPAGLYTTIDQCRAGFDARMRACQGSYDPQCERDAIDWYSSCLRTSPPPAACPRPDDYYLARLACHAAGLLVCGLLCGGPWDVFCEVACEALWVAMCEAPARAHLPAPGDGRPGPPVPGPPPRTPGLPVMGPPVFCQRVSDDLLRCCQRTSDWLLCWDQPGGGGGGGGGWADPPRWGEGPL